MNGEENQDVRWLQRFMHFQKSCRLLLTHPGGIGDAVCTQFTWTKRPGMWQFC